MLTNQDTLSAGQLFPYRKEHPCAANDVCVIHCVLHNGAKSNTVARGCQRMIFRRRKDVLNRVLWFQSGRNSVREKFLNPLRDAVDAIIRIGMSAEEVSVAGSAGGAFQDFHHVDQSAGIVAGL